MTMVLLYSFMKSKREGGLERCSWITYKTRHGCPVSIHDLPNLIPDRSQRQIMVAEAFGLCTTMTAPPWSYHKCIITLSLSLGAVSNSDVGGHGFPLFSVSCSFDDLDFTDFQQLAEAFHEVQPWSSSASLALNFPSDYDVLKSMFSHDMSQETHLPRSDSVHQFPLCSSSPQYLIICDMVLPRYV